MDLFPFSSKLPKSGKKPKMLRFPIYVFLSIFELFEGTQNSSKALIKKGFLSTFDVLKDLGSNKDYFSSEDAQTFAGIRARVKEAR